MTAGWKKREPESLEENVFSLIGRDWMLITAGTPGHYNTMTASWGALGVLWNRNVAICYVRPTRHTFGFLESADRYTLSFFPDEHHGALAYCGAHSGRDVNKAQESGITPCRMTGDTVAFEEARLVLVCRKLYHQDLDPARFLDPAIEEHYPKRDYHRMFVGAVEECLGR